MKISAQLSALAVVLILLPASFSCGGGSATSTAVQPSAAVAITEDSVAVGAGETHQFTAVVSGTSETAVIWRLSGCSSFGCGVISPTGLYTAPSVITTSATIAVTAVLQADASKFDTATVNHMPISISITPGGAWVMPGKTAGFSAAVRYDKSNAGVTWALAPPCSDTTCGWLSNATAASVTYTAPETLPSSPKVTLTATSIADPSKTAEVVVTVSATGGLLEGDYAFIFNGWEIRTTEPNYYWSYEVARSGHFHADSNGNISDGVEDINSLSGVSKSVAFTGSYGSGPDRRGTMVITSALGTETYNMLIDASGHRGKFIRSDGLPSTSPILGAGYFELQSKKSLSLSALAGEYAVGMFGSEDWNRVAGVGRFSVSPGGVISRGKMDLAIATHIGADPQATFTDLTLAGSLGVPSSATGRGTATLSLSPAPGRVSSSLKFAYYVISDEKIFLVQTDTRNPSMPVLSGEIRRQSGPFSAASFKGPGIFSMTGVNRANYGAEIVHAAVGLMVGDGSGSLTGIMDDNGGQFQPELNQAFTGSYSVAPDGRATLRPGQGNAGEIAYFFAPNQAFLLESSGTDVLFGRIKPQAAGSFTVASIAGTFSTATTAPASEQEESGSGITTFDGAGGMTSAMDVARWGDLSHFDFSGTYTVSANGRGTLTFTSPASNEPMVFWVVSPTELVGLGRIAPLAGWSALVEYQK